MSLKIAPTERIDWPPPYKEATEKYSAQVRLSPDGRSLVGYVSGEPFPILDSNDPHAADKIMWNVAFRPDLERRLRSALVRLPQHLLGTEPAVS